MNLTFQVCTRDLGGNIRSFGELTEDSATATNRIREAVKHVEGGSLYMKGVYGLRSRTMYVNPGWELGDDRWIGGNI